MVSSGGYIMVTYGEILGVVGLLCAIWVIYDLFAHQPEMRPSTKAIWVVLAIVFSIITAIIYYIIEKR